MNILPILNINSVSKLNFGNNDSKLYGLQFSQNDEFISQKRTVMSQIRKYLTSVGIRSKITQDNFLEIESLNKLPKEAAEITDYILQYTKKITGSLDFGAIGATNLGQVEILQGNGLRNKKFDFSTSEITNIGILKKIDGNMVINRQQAKNLDFEGLEVTGDIFISIGEKGSFPLLKKLDKFDKAALLGGFNILNY